MSMTREGLFIIPALNVNHPLLYDDDTLTHAANDLRRTLLIVGFKILDGRSWSYLNIELCAISNPNATIARPRLIVLPALRQ